MHARFRVGVFANGHTSSNTPDPIRTRKLSGERPGQYWGGGPPGKPLGCCWLFRFSVTISSRVLMHARFRVGAFANGHTSSNTPDPIRTRKLSGERPGQYWGGGPPGKPLGCCWLFQFSGFVEKCFQSWRRAPQKREVARTHHLIRTLSQNGYGDGCAAHPSNMPI